MKIIYEEFTTKTGNGTVIQNNFAIIKCHGKYLTMNIRRYPGWSNDRLDIRHTREFSTEAEAREHMKTIKTWDG